MLDKMLRLQQRLKHKQRQRAVQKAMEKDPRTRKHLEELERKRREEHSAEDRMLEEGDSPVLELSLQATAGVGSGEEIGESGEFFSGGGDIKIPPECSIYMFFQN